MVSQTLEEKKERSDKKERYTRKNMSSFACNVGGLRKNKLVIFVAINFIVMKETRIIFVF